MHYGKIERERRVALEYERQFGARYWDDVFATHEALGIGREHKGVKVMANLTPLKEKECVLVGDRLDEHFTSVVYETLNCLTDRLNVVSFNLVVWQRPLVATGEDWDSFPVVVRMVDRGDPLNRTADFGAMELYAASVVSSDPFKVARALWECLDAD
jgi:hypothetical protein